MPALQKRKQKKLSLFSKLKTNIEYLWDFAFKLLTDPAYTWKLCCLLIIGEIILNILVVHFVKYTEIDWVAYMQEVEGFINGTRDYTELKGDTGPLVYPAAFVYIYSALYYLTSQGTNIKVAQYIFCLFYVINLALVVRIYEKTRQCPPYVFIFMCMTSYRIHSIFVLRLFNDPVAMMIFYASVNLFLSKQWSIGCIFYSLAVGVKMNIFLFAPALLVILLIENGILKTIGHLFVCLLTQIVIAIPFLLENPVGYVKKSFEFSRQFFYIWTVNWRLVPEEIFLNKQFQLCLLLLHLSILVLFAIFKWRNGIKQLFSLINPFTNWEANLPKLSPTKMVQILFVSNFIGMCFSRSLHYQFYVWYYHTLPFLLWNIKIHSTARLLIFGLIELSWNTYPSTVFSSSLLHVMHLLMLIGLFLSPDEINSKSKKT
uniref:dol-P-Man:Man(5)GlcNAc(2)-PP-Dol alpha-1,3-mannosyltransferase-like n=1 Tax=Styela clava TaxID=7725 RepID=UPI001939EC2F|nr:dol-P-Man:Man(5)GlcNAc(2)-PP-Dol alpha-1,3-mannosyltransferase-like [Styela clava]